MSKKITSTIAGILARKAAEKIKEQKKLKITAFGEKVVKSSEFKALQKNLKQLEDLEEKFKQLQKDTQEALNVLHPEFYVKIDKSYYDKELTVNARFVNNVDEEDLKAEIMLESHFAGDSVTAEEIIDKIVKKHGG